ncbi:hypothetical protein IAT38_001411 [Cryptococcus sp. DSM 104549]
MDISFESFANLVRKLGNPPKDPKTGKPWSPDKIFASWVNHLPTPRPAHSGKHIFRLLFPHEGSRRRYGLKENTLAQELEKVLGLKGLARWDSVCWNQGAQSGTGCLGREVEIVISLRSTSDGSKSRLSLRKLDAILDELASFSHFSQLSQTRQSKRTPSRILASLYRDDNVSPYALSVLTQIILRDLRPLLDPLPRLPTRNPTAMLRLKSTAGPKQLTLRDAMMCWDRRMWGLYAGGRGDLDVCADLAEALADGKEEVAPIPVVGVNVKIPKCRKGRSVQDALKTFTGTSWAPRSEAVWAETKYDGYRLQVHVEIIESQHPKITIYSKSTRDSTRDRLNTHGIICHTLGLPVDPALPVHHALHRSLPSTASTARHRRVTKSVILEAEVVPYNEGLREGGRGPGIEEFWWLGAAGVTTGGHSWQTAGFPKSASRHLCLAFFDVLLLDGENMLHRRYDERRQMLEQLIRVIPGFSMLAERVPIPMDGDGQIALNAMQEAFRESNDRREEGLVLKAAESTYANMRWQWVKLKKDYIPDLGDCVDLVLLGAGWDIDRARELRVDTSVFTTFYIGTLTNPEGVKSKGETPHFEILFRASYGLDRSQLEVVNESIRLGRWKSKAFDKDDPFKRRLLGLSWTYTLQSAMIPPSVLFEKPMCAEIMGAGFQKIPGSPLFEIRWPRLQKIFDPAERLWTEALTAQSLTQTAHAALGYNLTSPSPRSPEENSIAAAWRSHSTLAIVDFADIFSPPAPQRTKSAPDFRLGVDKESPPSPRSSPRGRGGRGREAWAQTGKRLREAVTWVEGQGHESDDDGEEDEGVRWLKSPVSSPQKGSPQKSSLEKSVDGGSPSKRRCLPGWKERVESRSRNATTTGKNAAGSQARQSPAKAGKSPAKAIQSPVKARQSPTKTSRSPTKRTAGAAVLAALAPAREVKAVKELPGKLLAAANLIGQAAGKEAAKDSSCLEKKGGLKILMGPLSLRSRIKLAARRVRGGGQV